MYCECISWLSANIVSGRIANRFDFGGTNCVVDAACASSLSAIKIAMQELELGECDAVLTGGVNVDSSCFHIYPLVKLQLYPQQVFHVLLMKNQTV